MDEENVRILYMEDDPGLARLFSKKLERAGYQVDVACNGKEGLSMVQSSRYDIVAVDHQMPSPTGLEVIRELSATRDPPAMIMVTGTGSEQIAVEALKLGAADYIIKDVDGNYLELLPALIKKVLRRQVIIEQRNRAQATLKESEEKYRTVVERANDGIIVVQDGIIKYANPRAAEINGLMVEEMIERPFDSLIHPDERDNLVGLFSTRRMAEDAVVSIYETALRHKDGRRIDVELNVGSAQYQEKPADLVIMRDVTVRKRMEEELIKIQKLDSIMTLAGGLAHDFNNLLTAILGHISLAKRWATDYRLLDNLQKAESASLQAKELTGRLISFSRGGEESRKAISIASLLKETAALVLTGSDVQCEFFAPDDLQGLEADEGQIRQCLCNLIMNAREAMPEGGRLSLRAENIFVPADNSLSLKEGAYVQLVIKDNGIGIPPENLGKIFDAYFTTKTHRSTKGVGLGLTICYSILRKQGGTITVQSSADSGTTCNVYLPALRPVPPGRP